MQDNNVPVRALLATDMLQHDVVDMFDLVCPQGSLLARFATAELANTVANQMPGCLVRQVVCVDVNGNGTWTPLGADSRVHVVGDFHPQEASICPFGYALIDEQIYPLLNDRSSLTYFTLEHMRFGELLAKLQERQAA